MPGPVRAIHDTCPALAWEDGFVAGNGELGLLEFGPPGRQRLVHTHHRFVLPNASIGLGPPQTAARLEQVRDLLLAGRRREAQRAFSDGRGLAWTQAFHPGPVLHVDGPRAEVGDGVPPDFLRRVDLETGELTTTWSHGGVAHRRRAFVSRPDRVAVVELTGHLDLTLRLSADTPGRPDDVLPASRAELREPQPGDQPGDQRGHPLDRREGGLVLEATYPGVAGVPGAQGFLGVTRVILDGGCAAVDGDRLVVRGATRALLLTRLARWSGRPRTRRLQTGLAALPDRYEVLLAGHAPAHADLARRCTLTLEAADGVPALDGRGRPDDPGPHVGDLLARADLARGDDAVLDPTLVQTLFATGRHLLISSCGVLPPRLTGLWLGEWGAAWSGDFTTDANLNLQVAGLTTTGLPELLAGYVALLAAQVGDWRDNARAVYGARGFLAPSRTDGEHGRLFHVGDDWPWTMWLAGADWLLLPLVESWQAGGEDAFLAGVLAPWLVEAALFFEDVLTRLDADGRWILVPSWSPEVGPVTCTDDEAAMAGINATMDVAAARHALTTAADAVEHRGGDESAASRWRALAARLPEYRVDDDGALAEWAWPGLGTAPDHRHVSHLYPVWPLHEITPDATPELAEAAVAALQRRGDEDFSAHGSLHRALAAARLKRPDLARANLLKILGRRMLFRSLLTAHYPDLRVSNADAALCLPAVVVELLLDSRPGLVELLPALPPEWAAGRLTGSPTRAGAVVEELAWDLRRGEVRVVLVSADARELDVVCRTASDGEGVRQRVALAAGRSRELVIAVQRLTVID